MTQDQTGPKTGGNCGQCSPSLRNRYFRGKPMTVSDYEAEQTYMIGRRRLLSRSLLGWGLVNGFDLIADGDGGSLKVTRGLALDQCGRELLACEDVLIEGCEDVLWLEKDDCGWKIMDPPEGSTGEDEESGYGEQKAPYGSKKRGRGYAQSAQQSSYGEDGPSGGQQQEYPSAPQPGPYETQRPSYILSVHYAEAPIDALRVDDGCGATTCEANHLCETVVFSLRPADEEGPPFLEHDCACVGGEFDVVETCPSDPFVQRECCGLCGLCVHCHGWPDGDECDPCCKPKLVKWRGLYVAVNEGVPLAQVEVDIGKCDIRISGIVRVIGCCELTRIQDVGWSEWIQRNGEPVRFSEFAEKFDEPAGVGAPRDRRRRRDPGPSNTHFWVCFSGPVQVSSLAPDVMTISLIERAGDECKDHVRRIPIVGVAAAHKTRGDPDGTTRAFRPLVHGKYWAGEINPDDTSGFDRPTLVEIEVRTDLIADAGGHEVAGGGRSVPSSACVGGIHFLSSFTVIPDEDGYAGRSEDYAESAEEA